MKKTIKEIIDRSNLDSVTMKKVIQEVHAAYPNQDLNDKILFIKASVKEVRVLKRGIFVKDCLFNHVFISKFSS